MSPPMIRSFFDEPTNTVSYLVADPATKKAAIIDPVFDYDHNSGEVDTRSVEAMLAAAERAGNTIEWVLETHAHADHLSGAPFIKAKTGAKIGIGEHIKDVQRIFRPIFNATDLKTDGSDFDHLFRDGERFKIGELEVEILYTPGHTPADISYKIGDAVFVGDTLFMPDYGTARADFPGGDAHGLYRSIKRLAGAAAGDAGSSCVTTTRLPAATRLPGKPRCASSARETSTSRTASPKMNSWPCGRRATPNCRHRGCCCLPFRSTSAPANSRRPKPTGCAISRSP